MEKEKKTRDLDDDEFLEDEAEEEIDDGSKDNDSWGIDTRVLKPVTESRKVKMEVVKEVLLENLVEDAPVSEISDLNLESENYGSSVSTEGSFRGSMRDNLSKGDEKKEQMYMPEQEEGKNFYKSGHTDITGNIVSGLYNSRTKIDPSGGSWSTDTHLGTNDMKDSRGIDGKDLINQRDILEGHTFRGPGERDGFSAMGGGKPKYE
ncbi:MAG: hypothetical protein IH845_00685 [Nanoarchaeota archaeon]|nr:hypothetical protein [Nanoarchaeota archaeon]